MTIRPLKTEDAPTAAGLHIACIGTGFISSLGPRFVASLYKGIAESEHSFGFVAEEAGQILGFVAFTTDLSRLYKYMLLRKGLRFAFVLAKRIFSVRVLRKVYDNLCYPSRTRKMDLPDAELLSIAVAAEGRGKGIAAQLVAAGFEECRRRGIDRVKVLVAASNEAANKLYQKTGFMLTGRIDSHGVTSNIYVAQIAVDR